MANYRIRRDIQSKGGLARALSMSPRQRKQIARAAAKARWSHLLCAWCQKSNDTLGSTLCYDCRLKASEWQALAYVQVARAIERGDLALPIKLRCADCGRQAKCYDHRLYSAPLQVEPVCRSCNAKRGPALDFLNPKHPI